MVGLSVRAALALVLTALVACTAGSGSTGLDDGGADGGASGDASGEAAAPHCTPGAEIFCRCSDRTEGTKRCASDGQSFEPCAVEGGACP
jgi:hypothetical protein